MRDIVILGAGGVGRQVTQIIEDINARTPTWHLLGFLDDSTQTETSLAGYPVLGSSAWLAGHATVQVALAIGDSASRWRVATRLETACHPSYATLVHPTAVIGARSPIGAGSLLYAGVVIDPDVTIGCHVHINKNCTVGHDTRVGDYATLAPGVNVGGSVSVGEGSSFGIGSATLQQLSVGEWCVVGAGAVLIEDLAANTTAVGVPARPIKNRQPGWHEEA